MTDQVLKRALVIFNPNAGLTTKQDTRSLVENKLIKLGYVVDVFILDKFFERNIANYNYADVTLAVAVGGDGTVKVAARTILFKKLKIPLLIIPFGSANVTAVTLGVPVGTKLALSCLDNMKVEKVDVGLINKKHYFLVGLSIGYVSSFVTGASRDLKNKYGIFGYALKFIFNKIKISRIKFRIKTQNKVFWVKGSSLVIFNALNYFGLKPKKDINMQDGILNLYIFTNKTFFTLVSAFWHVWWHKQPKKYIFSLDNNYFKIAINRGLRTCQVDGDAIKLTRDIEVEVLPGALQIITK